jgi:hypothetical protein
MGVYEARGTLAKAMKELNNRFADVKVGWDDPVAHALENDFLAPMEIDLRNAISAMDHAGAILAQAKSDCDE